MGLSQTKIKRSELQDIISQPTDTTNKIKRSDLYSLSNLPKQSKPAIIPATAPVEAKASKELEIAKAGEAFGLGFKKPTGLQLDPRFIKMLQNRYSNLEQETTPPARDISLTGVGPEKPFELDTKKLGEMYEIREILKRSATDDRGTIFKRNMRNAVNLLGNLVRSIPQTAQLLTQTPHLAGKVAPKPVNKEVEEYFKAGAENIFRNAVRTFPDKPAAGKYVVDKPKSLGEYLDPNKLGVLAAENSAQMGLFLLTALANPIVGTVVMGAIEGGDALRSIDDYEERTGKEVPDNMKLAVFTVTSTINGALERSGLKTILNSLKATGAKSAITHALAGTLMEGGTEGAQGLVQEIAQAGYTGDLPTLKEAVDVFIRDSQGGFAMGLGAASVGGLTGVAVEKMLRKETGRIKPKPIKSQKKVYQPIEAQVSQETIVEKPQVESAITRQTLKDIETEIDVEKIIPGAKKVTHVSKEENILEKSQREAEEAIVETREAVQKYFPGVKVLRAPPGVRIRVNHEGNIEIMPGLWKDLKKRRGEQAGEFLKANIEEELIHQAQLDIFGGGKKANDALSEAWKEVPTEVQEAVRQIYPLSKANSNQLMAELLRMAAQLKGGGKIGEHLMTQQAVAVIKGGKIIKEWAENQSGTIQQALDKGAKKVTSVTSEVTEVASGKAKLTEIIQKAIPEKPTTETIAKVEPKSVSGKQIPLKQPQTGKVFDFEYIHNKEKAPDMGERFGQYLEPSGKYLLENTSPEQAQYLKKQFPEQYETDKKRFENPFVIEHDNWKEKLSEQFGATKKALTQKLLDNGYDGIVTVNPDGTTQEIVDLTVIGKPKAKGGEQRVQKEGKETPTVLSREQYVKEFESAAVNLTKEQRQTNLALEYAKAKTWKKWTGTSEENYFAENIQELRKGEKVGKEALAQFGLPDIKKVQDFKTDEGKFSVYDVEKQPRGRANMFTVFRSKDGFVVRNVVLPENMRRQGVATAIYQRINEESLKETGKPLRSSPPRKLLTGETVVELSKDAVALWDSFVKNGLAEKIGEKDYRFLPESKFYQESQQAPPFYSRLRQTIEQKMPNSADAQTVRGIIKDMKAEERAWTGIDEFLATKQKFTKQEMLDYLDANQVRIEKTVKGNYDVRVIESTEEWIVETKSGKFIRTISFELARTRAEAEEIAGIGAKEATKFSEYQLPGGENYREVLLRLPSKIKSELSSQDAKEYEKLNFAVVRGDITPEQRRRLDELERRLNSDIATQEERVGKSFRSTHFDELDILAHVRLNERTDSEGKSVLFIEEVQSDWHQKGRKEGYAIPPKPSDIKVIKTETGYGVTVNGELMQESIDKAMAEKAAERMRNNPRTMTTGAIPDAPFKTTWHEMAFRRMVREAAEQGKDRIAWTTGEQQVNRYPEALRQVADDISWAPWDETLAGEKVKEVKISKGGQRVLRATVDKDGNVMDATPSEAINKPLDQLIGKEMARRVLEEKTGTIQGKDFTVGGEGMKGFYDKIIVDYANKFGKKFGARVKDVEIGLSFTGELKGRPGESAIEALKRQRKGEITTVHALDITPEMKRTALEQGFPLFQQEKGAIEFTEEGKAIITAMESADVTTFIHEGSHSGLRMLYKAYDRALPEYKGQILNDIQTLEKWVGVKKFGFDNWTRPQHEKLARGFENFAATGKAPTPELQPVFERLKQWFIEIYKSIKGSAIDVKVPKEIREIFSRWLGAEAKVEPKPVGKEERSFPKTLERGDLEGGEEKYYEVFTDKKAIDLAAKRIGTNEEAAFRYAKDELSDLTKEQVTTGILLLKKMRTDIAKANGIEKENLAEKQIELAGALSQKLTQAGQSIQAASIVARLSPEGLLLYAQKRIAAINKTRKISKQLVITPEDVGKLNVIAKGIETATEIDQSVKDVVEIVNKIGKGDVLKADELKRMVALHNKLMKQYAYNPQKKKSIVEVARERLDEAEQAAKARLKDRKVLFQTASDQTDTPEFKRWFGKSKVVDEEENPLVVYHGTFKKFVVFDPSLKGKRDYGDYGKGFYFSSEDIAKMYSQWNKGQRGKGYVMPVYLSLQNPLNMNSYLTRNMAQQIVSWANKNRQKLGKESLTDIDKRITQLMFDYNKATESWTKSKSKNKYEILRNYISNEGLKVLGYDGIVGYREYIVFEPTQIKSALGNKGTFDPKNPNILFQAEGKLESSVLNDLAIIGAAKVGKIGVKFLEWSNIMAEDLGEKVRPHLKGIFKKSIDLWKIEQRKAHQMRGLSTELNGIVRKLEASAEITETELTIAKKLIEQIQEMTGDVRTEALMELQHFMGSFEPPSVGRKIATAQTVAQLLNPKTNIRNILGNEIFFRLERLNKYVAMPIDFVSSKLIGKDRTITFKKAGQDGYWKGLMKGAKAGWKGYNIQGLETQFDLKGLTFKSKINPLHWMEKAMGASLRGFDFAAYNRVYNQFLGEQAELSIINKKLNFKSKEAKQKYIDEFVKKADLYVQQMAHETGKYMTFQDENRISNAFVQLKKVLNLSQDFGVGDFVLKYPKTPANLLARALEYSPAGIVRAISILNKPYTDPNFQRRDATLALSRAITGTLGLTGMGAILYAAGAISGAEDRDRDVRAFKQEQTGERNYQVNISAIRRFLTGGFNPALLNKQKGDYLISYDWAQPVAISIAAGANIAKTITEQKSFVAGSLDVAYDSINAALNTLVEQPLLKGVQKALGNSYNKDVLGRVSQIFTDMPSSFVPTFFSQLKQYTDNNRRISYDPNPLQEALNNAIYKIPFVYEQLPKMYKTVGGEVAENYKNGSNTLFNVFFNPAFISKYEIDPEIQMLIEPYANENLVKQFPKVAPDTIGATKSTLKKYGLTTENSTESMKLTATDISEMQRIMSEDITLRFRKIDKANLAKKTYEEQEKEFAKEIDASYAFAKKWFFENRAHEYLKITRPSKETRSQQRVLRTRQQFNYQGAQQ